MGEIFRIDIKTRFIPDERKVYLIFPGNNYRYYQSMVEQSVVYLDLPGFPVPKNRNISILDELAEVFCPLDIFIIWVQ